MEFIEGDLDAGNRTIAIVVSRWNEAVTKSLLDGAIDELRRFNLEPVKILKVPGSWDIPVAIDALLSKAPKPSAVIALGCILQGQTPHAHILGGDVASALMHLQLKHETPITWGILTPDTMEQAFDRAGMKLGNKGREAAAAAIEMASLLGKI